MRVATAVLTAALFATSLTAEPMTERPKPSYPHTRAIDLVDPQFGEKVADPYRWLENDVRTDPTSRHGSPQNGVTGAYLKTLPGRDIFAARMKQLSILNGSATPRKAGTRYFYMRNDGLQNQSVLWVRDGMGGKHRVLIDSNAWAKDGATALAEWMPSDDGRYLLYGIQDGGTDWRTLQLLDVAAARCWLMRSSG